MSPLTRIAPGNYRYGRLGVQIEKTAMPHTPWELANVPPDGSGVVHARTLKDARAFLAEVERYCDHPDGDASGDSDAQRALLGLHRYLFPERYKDVAVYEWDASTIEDVAAMLERALTDEPRAQLASG